MRTRIDQLDRVAADLANVNTAGYKTERVASLAAERPDFGNALQSAVDVVAGNGRIDMRGGSIASTGRDFDFALEGRGFFLVQTPQGERLTRNGQFDRKADGTLVTSDGLPVLGTNGPIKVGTGAITVDADGTVRAGNVAAGRLRVVDVPDYENLRREGHGRFRYVGSGQMTAAADTTVRSGVLEQSNVSVVERMVQLTEVGRSFEALQRGLNVLMNDIDQRAISEFGRR
jgi:flagellar basal-body rod protein FlgG